MESKEAKQLKNSLLNYEVSKKALDSIDPNMPRSDIEDYYYQAVKGEVEKYDTFMETVEQCFDEETIKVTKAHFIDKKTFEDIGKENSSSERTIRQKLQKVLNFVADKMTGKGGEPE